MNFVQKSTLVSHSCVNANILRNFTLLNAGHIKFSHGNLAHVICMLFVNIKLFIIDNYLSKGFPGQLQEALCKCIDTIFIKRVYVKVAQLVEYVTSNDRLFYLRESGVRVTM